MLHLTPLLTSLLLFIAIIITNVLSDHSGFAGLEKYKIVWHGPIPKDEKFDDGDAINIATKNSERYQCIVPNQNGLNFDTSARNSSSDDDDHPFKLLEPLFSSKFCTYKFELFWVYELCHGKFLRQYHEENTRLKPKVTQEYTLGKMTPDQIEAHIKEYDVQKAEYERSGQSWPTVFVNGNAKPYIALNMTDGTKCDLTKNNRVARILYVCNDEHKHELHSIKETSTCEYEVIFLSSLLCQHDDFKPDADTLHEIKCYSVDGAPRKPENAVDVDKEMKNEAEDDEYKLPPEAVVLHIFKTDHL